MRHEGHQGEKRDIILTGILSERRSSWWENRCMNGLPRCIARGKRKRKLPAYPRGEAKAAHLLYFVIKNHPFSDGDYRSAAFFFLDILNRNGRLMREDGTPVINDVVLAALALLVAESDPKDKDVLIRLIMNMLATNVSGEE